MRRLSRKCRRYTFEGQALTDVEACAFDRRGFDALVARKPALAAVLAETLSQAVTQSAQAMLVLGKLRATRGKLPYGDGPRASPQPR